jgi:hypothetical protein
MTKGEQKRRGISDEKRLSPVLGQARRGPSALEEPAQAQPPSNKQDGDQRDRPQHDEAPDQRIHRALGHVDQDAGGLVERLPGIPARRGGGRRARGRRRDRRVLGVEGDRYRQNRSESSTVSASFRKARTRAAVASRLTSRDCRSVYSALTSWPEVFMSADPVQPRAPSAQFANRFLYTLNNPVRRVDPEGTEPKDPTKKSLFGKIVDKASSMLDAVDKTLILTFQSGSHAAEVVDNASDIAGAVNTSAELNQWGQGVSPSDPNQEEYLKVWMTCQAHKQLNNGNEPLEKTSILSGRLIIIRTTMGSTLLSSMARESYWPATLRSGRHYSADQRSRLLGTIKILQDGITKYITQVLAIHILITAGTAVTI